MSIKTPDQVRAEFRQNGVNVAKWAMDNRLSVLTVYQVLAGRSPGVRGEAYRAAVLLGLKPGKATPSKAPAARRAA